MYLSEYLSNDVFQRTVQEALLNKEIVQLVADRAAIVAAEWSNMMIDQEVIEQDKYVSKDDVMKIIPDFQKKVYEYVNDMINKYHDYIEIEEYYNLYD